MVDLPKGLLDKAKNELVKLSSNWINKVTRGAAWDFQGNEIVRAHSACHSWLTSAFSQYCKGEGYGWGKIAKTRENFLCLTCHSKVRMGELCSTEAMDAFVKFVARDTPFSHAVLNRDDDHSLTEGGLVILCGPDGLYGAQAMWLCKVLRLNSEGGSAISNWYEMVQRDVHPMMALYIASHLRSQDGNNAVYTGCYGHVSVLGCGNHNPSQYLHPRLNPDATDTASVFKPIKTIKGAKFGGDKIENVLKSWSSNQTVSDGWGGKVLQKGIPFDILAKNALEWEEEIWKPVKIPTEPAKDAVFLDFDV